VRFLRAKDHRAHQLPKQPTPSRLNNTTTTSTNPPPNHQQPDRSGAGARGPRAAGDGWAGQGAETGEGAAGAARRHHGGGAVLRGGAAGACVSVLGGDVGVGGCWGWVWVVDGGVGMRGWWWVCLGGGIVVLVA
jgi:hypothetical protein